MALPAAVSLSYTTGVMYSVTDRAFCLGNRSVSILSCFLQVSFAICKSALLTFPNNNQVIRFLIKGKIHVSTVQSWYNGDVFLSGVVMVQEPAKGFGRPAGVGLLPMSCCKEMGMGVQKNHKL